MAERDAAAIPKRKGRLAVHPCEPPPGYRSRRAQSHRNNRAPAFPAPDVTSAVAAENAAGGNSQREKASTTFNAYPLRIARLLFGMLPLL